MNENEPLPLDRSGLTPGADPSALLSQDLSQLFPGARHPQAALAGLLLKEGHWEESHQVAQDINDREGSYWHAILHRIEPDSANSTYWFRRVGRHPIFPALLEAAKQLELRPASWRLTNVWDPYRFNEWCEEARVSGGAAAVTARAIQAEEWQLLFEWCRQPA